jgi:hypothetical protein
LIESHLNRAVPGNGKLAGLRQLTGYHIATTGQIRSAQETPDGGPHEAPKNHYHCNDNQQLNQGKSPAPYRARGSNTQITLSVGE